MRPLPTLAPRKLAEFRQTYNVGNESNQVLRIRELLGPR